MAVDHIRAAQLYVHALRTGESSAAARAAQHLAPDVLLINGKDQYQGRDTVLRRITGQWPMTSVLLHGSWSLPVAVENQVRVAATFGILAASPLSLQLSFTFDSAGLITQILQEITPAPQATVGAVFPDIVRGIVNSALANGTPMVFACSNPQGQPLLSVRGSTQVYSGHQLSIWLRNPHGNSAAALRTNPNVSLLYRDSKTRTTLVFQGLAHIQTDDAVCARVYELTPEVEQNHDPDRKGAALLVDVTSLQGFTLKGPVRMQRDA